jgi:hypothetical protein
VHRVVYAIEHDVRRFDDLPVVRHSCDNPPCANPRHLVGGTMADNSADMAERGRHAGARRRLDRAAAERIRRLAAAGVTRSEIAELYGTSRNYVGQVLRGEVWPSRG